MSGCRLARKWSNRFSVIFLSWSFSRFIMTRNKLADGNLNLDLFYFKLDGPNLSWFLLPEEWRHFSWCRYLYTNSTQVFFAMEKSCELRLCAAPFTFDAINNFNIRNFSPRNLKFFCANEFFLVFLHTFAGGGDWQSERVSLLIWNTTDSFRWKITDRLVCCTHLKESKRENEFSPRLYCV